MKQGGRCQIHIAAPAAAAGPVQAVIELTEWDELEDVTADKDGGALMQALAEGEGWKKPTALDICEVLYSATPGTTYSDRTADITTFTQPSCAHLGV